MHRSAQVAVAAEDLIKLLLVDRRELLRFSRGRGVQALKANLAAHPLERHLAGGDALEQDHRELLAECGELIALAGGLSALVIHASAGAAIGQAQQLVKEVQQLIATLDHECLQQHQHQRVAARGLKSPDLLGGHSPSHRLQRAAPRRRQRCHVDLERTERHQAAVALDLPERFLHAGPGGASAQVRQAAGVPRRTVQQPVERVASRIGKLVGQERIDPAMGVRASGGDHPRERLDRWAQHATSAQVLTDQPHQRRRGVVLDRALDQPVRQASAVGLLRAPPVQVGEHELEVIAASLRPCAVGE